MEIQRISARKRDGWRALCALALASAAIIGGCSSEEGAESEPGPEPGAKCGDGTCSFGETCESCAGDCGACAATCGDGVCESVESCQQCSTDCGACPDVCGDLTCGATETCDSCAGDCGACPYCGDDTCDAGETCSSCKSDCGACPPECGDGTCNGDESWPGCEADCDEPPKVQWYSNGACAMSTFVYDGDADGDDWTWVRADTNELMWEDGTDVHVLEGTFVDDDGDLFIEGTLVASIYCSQGSNGCGWFWIAPTTDKYVDFYVVGNTYYWQETSSWTACQ